MCASVLSFSHRLSFSLAHTFAHFVDTFSVENYCLKVRTICFRTTIHYLICIIIWNCMNTAVSFLLFSKTLSEMLTCCVVLNVLFFGFFWWVNGLIRQCVGFGSTVHLMYTRFTVWWTCQFFSHAFIHLM